jgi:CRISPR-associated Csx2 family protein
MARKVFISFLGTTNYTDCNYYFESEPELKVEAVKFIQEALLIALEDEFGEKDACYFFLTGDARKMNWNSDSQFNQATKQYDLPYEGLQKRLAKLKVNGFKGQIHDVDILEGYSSDEIWKIFDQVFSKLEPGDRIFLDITHGFRSLPMLAIVLMNYTKALKDIVVEEIYYGAFEKLGHTGKVKALPLSQRNAPIIELQSFATLQNWSNAASDFIEFGNTQNLANTLNNEVDILGLADLSKKQKGRLNHELKEISKIINEFAGVIATNRGHEIINNKNVEALKDSIKNIKQLGAEVAPLIPFFNLLKRIEREVAQYRKEDLRNGFIAVQWCKKNKLIQQGLTLLQEFLVSLCLDHLGENYDDKNFRDFISAYLGYRENSKDDFEFNKIDPKKQEELIILLQNNNSFLVEIKAIYHDLANTHRNDINHAGFGRQPRSYQEFEKALDRNLLKVIKLFELNL